MSTRLSLLVKRKFIRSKANGGKNKKIIEENGQERKRKWREKMKNQTTKRTPFLKLLCSTFRYQNELQVIQGQWRMIFILLFRSNQGGNIFLKLIQMIDSKCRAWWTAKIRLYSRVENIRQYRKKIQKKIWEWSQQTSCPIKLKQIDLLQIPRLTFHFNYLQAKSTLI